MTTLLLIFGSALLALVAAARLLFLAGSRTGWVMYLANVAWESAAKLLHVGRFRLEAAAAVLGLALLKTGGVPWGIVALAGALLLILETANRLWERRLLTDAYTTPDTAGPAPSAHPELILTLEAPFIERLPHYRLGVLWVGRPFDIELVLGNHTRMPTQTPVRVRLSAPSAWLGGKSAEVALGPRPAGSVARARWTLQPDMRSDGGQMEIVAEWSGVCRRIRIEYAGCRFATETTIDRVTLDRYPGGRRCAFAWRGDMDLYDTTTFQSIAGLETPLGLAARYCFPQTMCLSTRLSLDETAAREWAEHYGVDRGAAEIPHFTQWLRAEVELRHICAYPALSRKRYLMELGNHGHLHFGTATSAAPENGWLSHAHMGAGHYAWMGDDASSFGEQRDNALEARRWCEQRLAFTPRSWAKPGRCNDADTPRAVEAAGCEVLSGSDIRARDNVLFQPPPHHPGDTAAVELTTRYPCDPQNIYHVGMLRFWLYRSQRLGIPMVYMCHQHLRQFEGPACARFTEYLLRTVLADFHGEFHINTLFGVGKYWREVMSPKTRRVSVVVSGTRLTVDNRSDMDLNCIPLDLTLAGGGRSTLLVSVPSGTSQTVDLAAPHPLQEK